jgi:hypothetical protein
VKTYGGGIKHSNIEKKLAVRGLSKNARGGNLWGLSGENVKVLDGSWGGVCSFAVLLLDLYEKSGFW